MDDLDREWPAIPSEGDIYIDVSTDATWHYESGEWVAVPSAAEYMDEFRRKVNFEYD